MHSKRARIIAIVIVALMAIGAAIAAYTVLSRDSVVQVSSPWPVADSERSIAKPEAPAVWPLTGLPAPSADAPAALRIVSVKIENSPEARPQAGIQSADVVYESITEGGITRFNCLFHSTNPEELVGPVRSARLSDTHIVPQYSALFVFSGASTWVNSKIRAAGLENLSEDIGVSTGYQRVTSRYAPHNLFLDLPTMREEAVRRGFASTQQIKSLAFDRASVDTTQPISHITIPFSTSNTSEWTYDPTAAVYLRENNGRVHEDSLTGEQVSATNVVVLWAKMIAQGTRDVTGSTTYNIELTGSGRATIFRDGAKIDCTWEASADAPPRFKASDGTAVRLSPGNTWFQVVPTNVNIAMQ